MSKPIRELYRKLSTKHLFLLHSLQAGTMISIGDLVAQTVIEKKPVKEVKLARTGRFMLLGAVMVGPTLSIWFKFLSRIIPPTGKFWGVKKVALDQLGFAPCFIASFVSAINTLEGREWEFTKRELRLKYKDMLITNWQIWPAAQLFNFYFVPLRNQVLVVQCVAIVFNSYLSWKSQQGKSE